ncbi:AAWKG family protein [Streptomyces lydicus]
MPDDTPINPGNDDWQKVVTTFTGYPVPSVKEVLDNLKGHDGTPLMHVTIEDAGDSKMPELEETNWQSENFYNEINTMHIKIPFYTNNGGLKKRYVSIQLLGIQDTKAAMHDGGAAGSFKDEDGKEESKWDTTALARYSYGAGHALDWLLTKPQGTRGFDWGPGIEDKAYVDPSTFEATAQAFDRVENFVNSRKEVLDGWEKEFGAVENENWKGQAAGVWWNLVHLLVRRYERLSEDMHATAERAVGLTWTAHGSKQGAAVRYAGMALLDEAQKLHDAWEDWAGYTNGYGGFSPTPKANPLFYLNRILNQVMNNVWEKNIFKVSKKYSSNASGYTTGSSGYKPDSEHLEAQPGFSSEARDDDRSYGELDSPQTWKNIGQEALDRWWRDIRNDLGKPAEAAKQNLMKAWSTSEADIGSIRPPRGENLQQSLQKDQAAKDKKKAIDDKAALDKINKEKEERMERERAKEKAEAERIRKEQEAKADKQRADDLKRQEEEKARQDQIRKDQEAKQEAKEKEQEAKQEAKEKEQEAKQREQEAKQEAKEKEQEAKQEQQRKEQEAKQHEQEAKQEAKEKEQEAKQDQIRKEQEKKQEEQQHRQEERQDQQVLQQRIMQVQQKKEQEQKEKEQQKRQEEQEAKQEQQRKEQEAKQEEQQHKQEQKQEEQEAKQDRIREEQEKKQEEQQKEQEKRQEEQQRKQEAKQEEQEHKQEEQQRKQEAKQEEQEHKQEEQQRKQEQKQEEQEAKQDQIRKEQEQKQGEQQRHQEQRQDQQQQRQDEQRKEQERRQEELQKRQEQRQQQYQDKAGEILGGRHEGSPYGDHQSYAPDSITGPVNGDDSLTNPGGSHSHVDSHGRVVTEYPDGSKATIDPQTQTSSVTGSDGKTHTGPLNAGDVLRNPDGSVSHLDSHGQVVTEYRDGSTSTVDPRTGAASQTSPDGTTNSGYLTGGSGPDAHGSGPGGPSRSFGGQSDYEHELYDPQSGGSGGQQGAGSAAASLGGPSGGQGGSPGGMPMSPGMMGGGMGGMGGGGGQSQGGPSERTRNVIDGGDVVSNRRRPSNGRAGGGRYDDREAVINTSGGTPFAPGGNGAGGPGRQQTQSGDRERESWVPEDEDVWGSDEGGSPAVIGR